MIRRVSFSWSRRDVGAAQDATEVDCMCGFYGSLCHTPHAWVPLDVTVGEQWPTLCLQSLRVYKPPKKRRRA